MGSGNCINLLNLFHILCIFTTTGFVGWCIHEYLLDHDYTETTFATFHETSNDIYPSITICDMDPFVEEKFDDHLKSMKEIGTMIKSSNDLSKFLLSYKLFLKGAPNSTLAKPDWLRNLNATFDQWLNILLHIDYDAATNGLEDLISDFHITFPMDVEAPRMINYQAINGSLVATDDEMESFANSTLLQEKTIQLLKSVKTYISFREAFRKCLTIDIPHSKGIDMREVGISFNTSGFPAKKIAPGKFFFYLTYPKQIIRAPLGSGMKLPFDRAVSCYKFEIHIGYMRVVRRRNKERAPCNSEWNHHDEIQMSYISRKIGCTPKHWKMPSDLPYCSIPQQHLELKKELHKKNGFMPPCRSIETLLKTTKGKTDWRMCLRKSFLDIKIFLDEQSHYEEVFLFPSYSLQSLVGNSGTFMKGMSRRTKCTLITN